MMKLNIDKSMTSVCCWCGYSEEILFEQDCTIGKKCKVCSECLIAHWAAARETRREALASQ